MLVAAVGIDAEGTKHPLGVIEGATENAATVRALLDNLIGRGLDPAVCRWFIVDGARALSKAIRNLAQRLEREAPGVSASILEGLDEILTVNRLGSPADQRRSLACTNIVENMSGTIRRLKAYRQLPLLKPALAAHQIKYEVKNTLDGHAVAA
jgi:putative transposase